MSLKTDNFKLYKYEDNDIGDLRFINDSMDIIDKGINPFYVATQSSTNVYKVTTELNKTSLANGYSIKVAIPSNSTGAVSITVDSVTVPVKKPNGNAVTNFKANGVYSLTYYNSVFILASGGVDDVSFSASDLLTGKTANDSNGEKVNGTMPNKGTVTQSLSVNGSLTLPSGYYDSIKITQNIPNRGEYQYANGVGSGDDSDGGYIAFNKIPYGYYPQSSNGWAPEIRAKKSAVANHIGLTANKIVAGNTICGVTGTATIASLGGYTKTDIKNKGIITRYKVVKQGETALNTNGKTNNMYEVLQRSIDYVRSSGDKICDIFYISNNKNDLIFHRSSGTCSTAHNEDHYDYLQYVNFNSFTTTNYISSHAYLPLDQVGDGLKYQKIPRTGTTKYGSLIISEHRSGSSDGDSWCTSSTIRLQTKALTYDLLTLQHYGWLFNYSSSSDTFTTIEDRKEGSTHKQYKVTFKIVPEIVDKDGNVIS